MKLQPVTRDGTTIAYVFYCPGCETPHQYMVDPGGKLCWKFNGDLERSTFSPSLLMTSPGRRCHLFVRDGQIQYCGDCHHDLAGKTVDVPEWTNQW